MSDSIKEECNCGDLRLIADKYCVRCGKLFTPKEEKSVCCGAQIDYQVGMFPNTRIRVCSACQMCVGEPLPREDCKFCNKKPCEERVGCLYDEVTEPTSLQVKCCENKTFSTINEIAKLEKMGEKGGEECKDCKEGNYPHGHCIHCKKNTNLCECAQRQNGNWKPTWQERLTTLLSDYHDKDGYWFPEDLWSLENTLLSFISSEKLISEQEVLERVKKEVRQLRQTWHHPLDSTIPLKDSANAMIDTVLQILSTLKKDK